ncbi:hypothetical protein OMK73_05585 [Cupriavidus sp. D39]|nr:hypothetical protein [Cupriavidus sp. D39]MCY0853343.1 hypothetical protein [Cupriavidus sp. D39]
MTDAEMASDDEYRFGTTICASARQYAADKVSRDLMVAILLEHTDRSDDDRLSILLRTSATYYALAQYSDMKDAQCLVDDVARQSTTFEDICNGGPISLSCCPDLHVSHHSRHLLVSYCELKTENTKKCDSPRLRAPG